MNTATVSADFATHAAGNRISAWRKIASFQAMLGSLLALLAVLTVRSRFNDVDLWWHLKTGQIVWTTHTIPTTDLFSYTTHHHAWVPHEWLSQVLIYGAYKLGGYSGLMLWLCIFTTVLLLAGYLLCSLYSGSSKVGFVGATVIWFCSTVGFSIRPQLIGYLLLLVEMLLLHLGRTRNPRWFFGLPLLFAVWVNCHGSFFFGFCVLGLFLFCSFFHFRMGSLVSLRWDPRSRRSLMWSMVLSGAALFLNPLGIRQVLYPLNVMLHQPIVLSQVQEWLPLPFNDLRGFGFLTILGSIFFVLILRHSELFLDELLLLAVSADLAIKHQRMIFVFGILAAPVLARLLTPLWDSYHADQDRPWLNAGMIALSVLVMIWAFPSHRNLVQQVDRGNPVGAVEFIKTHHLQGNMLNDLNYGGYLIWAAPQHPVFVDTRNDVYEWTGVLDEFAKWATLQSNPNTLLDRYGIDFCLLDRESPMAHVLPLMQGWKTIYSDDRSVIFERVSAIDARAVSDDRGANRTRPVAGKNIGYGWN